MDPKEEAAYVQGERAAWVSVLYLCLRHLGYDHAEAAKAKWIVEREEIVAVLRGVCRRHGDNEWPDTLHLGDVIEKHLERHLQ